MAYVFCNQCGHRNPPESSFCSSCGTVLDRLDDHTVTLAKVDPLLDAPGPQDDVVVHVGDLPVGASLVVRNGPQAGTALALTTQVTKLGRHPDSEISLDDITVSRRHAEVEHTA
ncbi:MAG: zinc ribbon domain-containing protein, partial [Ilumatobacter sp.]|nr:zinc ribbon domain-containing protein [Ilumatobacter sp.]